MWIDGAGRCDRRPARLPLPEDAMNFADLFQARGKPTLQRRRSSGPCPRRMAQYADIPPAGTSSDADLINGVVVAPLTELFD